MLLHLAQLIACLQIRSHNYRRQSVKVVCVTLPVHSANNVIILHLRYICYVKHNTPPCREKLMAARDSLNNAINGVGDNI